MKQWRIIFFISTIVIAITLSPFIFGWLQRPPDTVFSGRHGLSPGDFSSYYQMIEQARQGRVLFTDPFTSEPHEATIFNPYWLLVGQMTRVTGWSGALVFQLARIMAIPLLIAALFYLIRQLIIDDRQQRFVLVFSIFASGIGAWSMLWLSRLAGVNTNNILNQPIDLWVSEAVTFLTLFQTGHFITATALIIIIFLLLYRGLNNNLWRPVWWASAAGLFLFFFHPFHVPTVFAVMAVFFVTRSILAHRILWSWLPKLLLFSVLTMPAWLYQLLMIWFDPIAAGRAVQNINQTPALWNLLLGYGFLIPLALVGVWSLWRQKKLQGLFLFMFVWLMAQAVLIYAPLDWQRRLTHGWQVPLTIFAGIATWQLYLKLRNRYPATHFAGAAIGLGVAIFAISNLYVVANDLSLFTSPQYRQAIYGLFYPPKLSQAFTWAQKHIKPGDPILAHSLTGNYLVGETALTTYVGHSVETLNFESKTAAVKLFFSPASTDEQRLEFLHQERIKYVFYGPIERYYSWYDPVFLAKIYVTDDVTIYLVPQ